MRENRRSQGDPLAHLTAVNRVVTKFLRNSQKLIVLGHAIGSAKRTGLDLTGVRRDRDIGNGCVFRFTGAMTDHGGVIIFLRQSMASRVSVSVPIWFTLTRIELATSSVDSFAEKLNVGHEKIVADQLNFVAEPGRSTFSSRPNRFPHSHLRSR